MTKYIIKRVLRSLITMFIIITVLFALLRMMPIEGYFENYDKMTEVQIQAKLNTLGLNDPLHEQLLNFYNQLLHGDLGTSNKYRIGVSINEIIAEKIPVSLRLGLTALCISLSVGLTMGIMMARSTRTRFKIGDKLGTMFIGHIFEICIQGSIAHITVIITFVGHKTSGDVFDIGNC